MGVQTGPMYEGLFLYALNHFWGFHTSFPLLLSFVKGLVRGKARGAMGSAASWGAKGLFFGDAAHRWRVQGLAADLAGVCCGCVGGMSTGREGVEKAVPFV